jgi:membrane-associated phospholipid phosphatase
MQLRTVPQAAERGPGPRLLLPGPLRVAGTAVLAGCAVTPVLAALVAGRGQPGWLDSVTDPRIQSALSRFPLLLRWLPEFGTPKPATLMTLALALAFVAARRWTGALLAIMAVPAATGLTEYVLKPYVGTAMLAQSFPSGHATCMFALAAIWAIFLLDPGRGRMPGALRLVLALLGLVLAGAVAAVMVAIGAHTLTDVIAGTAVGTGVVVACALSLDLVVSRVRPGRTARPASAGWPVAGRPE